MRAAILTLADARPPEPTLEALLEAVAVICHVPRKELMARRRWASYAKARNIYFYAARTLTSEKCIAISGILGRDHSTGSNGYLNVVRNPARYEPELSRVMSRFQPMQEAA